MASTTMDIGWAAGLTLLNAAWLVLVVFGLPGNWLMVLSAAAIAWWRWDPGQPVGDQMFSLWTLGTAVALAGIGEALEFVAGMAGAARAGGSRRGAVAAIIGGIVGAITGTTVIPVPVVGSLLGAAAGAAIGAFGVELAGGKPMDASVRIGLGAGAGRLLGTVFKLAVGVAIWVVLAVSAFWP